MPDTSHVELLDDEATAAAARLDPLRAQNVSLRVPGTDVLSLGSAVAVHQRLGQDIDDWCITGSGDSSARLGLRSFAR